MQRNVFYLMEKTFFGQTPNGTNITENSFAPQNEPHTNKLSFSGILNHFHGNKKKILHAMNETTSERS